MDFSGPKSLSINSLEGSSISGSRVRNFQTERKASYIMPSYYHPPIGFRNLVNRCGSPGSCEPYCLYLMKILLRVNKIKVCLLRQCLKTKTRRIFPQNIIQVSELGTYSLIFKRAENLFFINFSNYK